jgi:hypothetical protein
MRGGIFLRKIPLGVYVSVKSRIETAVANTEVEEVLRYESNVAPYLSGRMSKSMWWIVPVKGKGLW